jgi:hypothetical protein
MTPRRRPIRRRKRDDDSSGHHACESDDRWELLDLKAIMALETDSNLSFSLKVLACSFEIVAAEFLNDGLRAEILSTCEQNVRHGHTLHISDSNT